MRHLLPGGRECTVHENYKEKVLKAKDTDTIVTGKRLGHPVRSLKNPFSRNYMKREYDPACSDDELEQLGVGALRKAAREGDVQNGCIPAGRLPPWSINRIPQRTS